MQTYEAGSFESIKPPFFIREATLEKTLERIRAVPPEKRRIIVYAGVHPNEATDVLSEKYAKEWADRYGALVVCQPTTETPQGIWKSREFLVGEDGVIPQLPADIELDERRYQNEFALGEKTFFVQFHGTPIDQWREWHTGKRSPKLEVILPIRTDAPLEGLQVKLPDAHPEEIQAEYPRQRLQPGNAVLVEWFYHGRPPEITDPYLKKVVEADRTRNHVITAPQIGGKKTDIGILSEENWDYQMNIGPSYIEQHTPTDGDYEEFDRTFKSQLETILQHISSRLPRVE